MILYHSADLFWATRIKGVAEAIGIAARPVRTVQMLEDRLKDSPARALLVDLEAPEIALAMINRLRSPNATPTERAIRIAAYGPHVAVELFEAARKAGADHVLARGVLSRHMPTWLASLGASETDATSEGLPTTE